jgi:hypothetical protein
MLPDLFLKSCRQEGMFGLELCGDIIVAKKMLYQVFIGARPHTNG